jgi:Protein of unknown function (DUF3684)
MESIAKIVGATAGDEIVTNDTIHLMNTFTFNATTPSARVGNYIEETFLASSKDGTILLLTSRGVRRSNHVRIASRDVPFLINTPILSDSLSIGAPEFISRLKEADILNTLTWQDVKKELNGRPLSVSHTIQFLKWILEEKLPYEQIKELLSIGLVACGEDSGKIVNLGYITAFVVPGKIPVDGGLPPYVLPLEIGRCFTAADLKTLYVSLSTVITVVIGENLQFKNGLNSFARHLQLHLLMTLRSLLNLQQ